MAVICTCFQIVPVQPILLAIDTFNPRVIQGFVWNLDSFRVSGFKGK